MNPIYWRKCAAFCSFFISCIVLVLLSLSLATDFWIVAQGKREISVANVTSRGSVNFGLFKGVKRLDSGLGERVYHFKVSDLRVSEPSLMLYDVWMATVAVLCAGVLFSLLLLVFSIINVASSPVHWLPGPHGLLLWNALAALFELSAMVLWSVQYYARLRHNVFVRKEVDGGWTSDGMTSYSYSYWLVLAAILLHAINMCIVWSSLRPRSARKLHVPVDSGHASAVNMIY